MLKLISDFLYPRPLNLPENKGRQKYSHCPLKSTFLRHKSELFEPCSWMWVLHESLLVVDELSFYPFAATGWSAIMSSGCLVFYFGPKISTISLIKTKHIFCQNLNFPLLGTFTYSKSQYDNFSKWVSFFGHLCKDMTVIFS